MAKFLFLLGLLMLVPVAARAEESAAALAEATAPTITEPMAVSVAMPVEPEMKYISSEPISLETSPMAPTEPGAALSSVSDGGLLIPEMTAPIAEPEIAKIENLPAADIKEINPILENGFQANMGE